jgi:poly [ADP-ribose] polymerase 2/3/4
MSSPLHEVVLNWTDLTGQKTGATSLGSNKFYKAQLFSHPKGFRVLFTYGRVGQAGQTQEVVCGDRQKADQELEKKVNEKLKKGYSRVDLRAAGAAPAKPAVVKKVAKGPKKPSAFHPEVEFLLSTLYGSTGAAVAAGLSATSGATADAPLGNLSDTQLDKGADVLEAIEKLLGKGKPQKKALLDLTNEFYSAIPRKIDHARVGGKLDVDLILLSNEAKLKEQRGFLSLLRDAAGQRTVFAAAAAEADPTQVWYDGLKCDIEYLEPKSAEYKHLKSLFDSGQSPINSNFYGKLKMGRAWRLEQQGRKAAFDAYAKTVVGKSDATGLTPGWHGTRTENLMGICKTGLVLPKNLPKGVVVTGRVFGSGIYHTPCWPDSGKSTKDEKGKAFTRYNGALKSLNYTSLRGAYYFNDNTAARGFMFSEELALGVPELALKTCTDKPAPKKGCDYIYARAHGHQSLSNDEVVTFDENASRRTAIIEVVYK